MKIFEKFRTGNTLYYPGCLSKFAAKKIVKNYKKILQAEGIDFVMLGDNEVCCGSPVKNAGADKRFKELAKKNLEIFRERGVSRIISNCPSCVAIFRLDYPEILGQEWRVEAKQMVEIFDKSLELLKKNQHEGKTATYHDPCHLGRLLGIFERPREVIKKAGFELVEMELSRQKSFCCGGGGGVKTNNLEVSNAIGKDRVAQAKATKADVLITNCPMCFAQLKENSSGMEVMEMSELFFPKSD